MKLPQRWISKLTTLGLILAGALILGLWFDAVGYWLAAALGVYLAATLRNLYLLDRALSKKGGRHDFGTRGFWAQLVANVEKLRSKSRMRKRRYHQLVREVRESTGALSDAGVILNADREIVWFNPAATELLGLDRDADIGHRIDNLLRHPDLLEYLDEQVSERITIPSPLDDTRTLSVQCIPYGQNQRLAIFRDITHEIQLERTRRDFVANASHELRSPLTVITGYLDTISEDPDLPAAWKAPVEEMLRQSHRMTRILRDLIELARLDTVGADARFDFVDVEDMLKRIVHETKEQSGHPGIDLSIETDSALLGNESDLHSIFFNLISNAVRFTPESGSVRVVWRREGDGAVLEVIDTGIGIPAELVPRLTERFYRVDTSRSRATGGTGLGLAIVKHAVQRHDGELSIRSEVGEGSTFACRFPAERLATRGGRAEAVV